MEILKAAASTNHWHILWPELSLGVVALLLLAIDALGGPRYKRLIPTIAIGAQLAILLVLVSKSFSLPSETLLFAGLIKTSALGHAMRIFFVLSSVLVSYIAYIYLSRNKLPRTEFFHITLIATAAAMLLAQSNHFLMLFVALETLTVSLFVLISFSRENVFSLEAGLKFLVSAALSSSMMLFGIVLLYGLSSSPASMIAGSDSMAFANLTAFVGANLDNTLVKIAIILILCGVAFKIGAFPFQIWIPDVYQGAPLPTTAFLAVSSKAAGVIVLINLVKGPFAQAQTLLIPVLSTIAIATILFGNITAIPQNNVKRIIGLSGIAHAGYILMGIVASYAVGWAINAVVFYLFTYLLASFAVFYVIAATTKGEEDSLQITENYERLSEQNPFLSVCLLVGLGSLAGIPPLVGFIGKLFIFIAAFKAHLYALLAVAILGVVISIYYYFGWLREAFFFTWRTEDTQVPQAHSTIVLSPPSKVILSTISLSIIALGLYQGFVGGLIF